MNYFSANPETLRVVWMVLLAGLFSLGQVAADHSMCLPETPDTHQRDGFPCVWMDGFLASPDIMGVCNGGYCKPNKSGGHHNNFIFRGLFQRIRDLNDRVRHWDEHY